MSKLDPVLLFRTLCRDIPQDLHKDVFVAGSLAAAYAFKVRLLGQAVNTKDADLLVHPAGNVASAQTDAGMGIDVSALRGVGERILADAMVPLEQSAATNQSAS
jgi:hypothetical protein